MTPISANSTLLELVRHDDCGRGVRLSSGDWETIVTNAIPNGLAPWLYCALERSASLGALPPRLAERLRREALGSVARNMMLQAELVALLRACEGRGIPCVPLRGLALAELLYGDATNRPTGDLDLLVRRADLERVTDVLRELDFRDLSHQAGFARAFSYTLVFGRQQHGWIVVEPHWTIAYPPFAELLDMDAVWARCRRHRTVGIETWFLSDEDLLLHLCLHLLHSDGTVPLLWFYELDRFVRREEVGLDWSRLASIVGVTPIGVLVARALAAVRELFGTPVPAELLRDLGRPPARRLDRRISRLLVAEGPAVDGREELAVFLSLPNARLRLRYVLGLLFPSVRYMMMRYELRHSSQLPLAYFRRCCHLAWAAGRGMLRLMS